MSCGAINITNYNITGDCTNLGLGAISFSITGGSPNYTVSEITTSGLLPLSSNTTSYSATSLTAGTYVLEIIDSCLVLPLIPRYIEFTISSGTCVSIESSGTTCGLNNGSITATTTNFYGNASYYLYENTIGYITSGDSFSNVFNNLSPGFYYVIGNDGGGCTGRSEVCLIKESNILDFGLYVVNDASCVPIDGTGKIFVTGLTGNPPYSYVWSPNVISQTGPEITGLTSGTYTLTITDSEGCSTIKSVILSDVPNLGVAAMLTTVQPSCFSNDGEVDVIISGGTAPYYFSGSNGEITIQYSNTFTFTGLSSGVFTVSVTDAGLCNVVSSVSLITPNGFIVTTMTVTNSNCNANDGSVHIELNNGLAPGNYQYTLLDFNGGSTVQTTNSICDFGGLASGNYTVLIQDVPNNSGCIYTGNFTVVNVNKYEINVSYSDTTCGQNNGIAIISATSGGDLPLTYSLSGGTPSTTTTQLTNVFNNLSPGFYLASVTDSGVPTCTQTELFYIAPSQSVDFNLVTNPPILGNDGEIFLNITNGTPPFLVSWSPNVGSQTGLHVTGLTSGVYTVTVADSNDCVKTESVLLKGTEITTNYVSYTICSDNFINTETYGKRGILQMMNEGFFDLTSGDSGCVIVNATFTTQVEIDGIIKEDLFYTYTGGSFAQYADIIWTQSLKNTLKKYPQVGDVIIDMAKNKITITNKCNEVIKDCQITNFNDFGDTNVKINLLIDYLINCRICGTAPEGINFIGTMELIENCNNFNADITMLPTCVCYILTNSGRGVADFEYVDCQTQTLQTITVGDGLQEYVCSNEPPTIISGVGTIVITENNCVDGVCITTTTTVGPPPNLLECDVIAITNGGNNVFSYYPSTNTGDILTPYITGWVTGSGDIAHTNNKLWISRASASAITEYNITLTPFNGTYNRDILINDCLLGAGLTAIDDTTLITTTGDTTVIPFQERVIEVDISGVFPIITDKFLLPSDRSVSGDIIYTTTNKLIVTTESLSTINSYISQYDYTTGILEIDIDISTVSKPFGLFTDSGKITITNSNGKIYTIDETTPYNLNFLQTAPVTFGGASQVPSCETINFII